MTEYICPQCNTLMAFEEGQEFYICRACNIKYCDYLDNDPYNHNFMVNGTCIAIDTFEKCCRIYKLKVFL